MIEFGSRSEDVSHYSAWLGRETSTSEDNRRLLEETYETMRRLQNEGRNHIWGYVARNLARPIWLSSENQKADVIVGNPPWVAYRRMKGAFQDKYKKEAVSAKLWWSKRGTSGNDLSAYFFMRAALLYMQRNGHIALVMPYAAMSRQAYRYFRNGLVSGLGDTELGLRFTGAWSFGPEVYPLFPVPSCVLFARVHGGNTPASLPERITAFSGVLPRRDADALEADAHLTSSSEPWPSEASSEGGSPYRKRFRQGAILLPRRLVLVERIQTGAIPPNPETPLVRGKAGNQDKDPWKYVTPPRGIVEQEFLRPALLGASIAAFRVIHPLEAVIPWDEASSELLDSAKASEKGFVRLAQWLRKTEGLWTSNGKGRRTLLEQYDYFSQLSKQFPIPSVRVVYTKAGTNLVAAVVRDTSAVIDHKLYWGTAEIDEALYLCGILNTETVRQQVEQYQSQGQWGARDFDKYVFNVPIPTYDSKLPLHRDIVAVAKTAESVAREVNVEDGDYFLGVRKRVRIALNEGGVSARLELLVKELLDPTR